MPDVVRYPRLKVKVFKPLPKRHSRGTGGGTVVPNAAGKRIYKLIKAGAQDVKTSLPKGLREV